MSQPQKMEALFGQIQHLIQTMPDLLNPTDPTVLRWLGRAYALVGKADGLGAQVEFSFCQNNLHSQTLGPGCANRIAALLYRSLALVEIHLPVDSQGAFIPAGNSFDTLVNIGKIFAAASRDLLLVDRYFDHTILSDHVILASEGVTIRLLTVEGGYKQSLIPAARHWKLQHGARRPLEIRAASPKAVPSRTWLELGAARSPVTRRYRFKLRGQSADRWALWRACAIHRLCAC